ncbi:MAG: PAS domain-containing protein [Deltaproteobacteria bacterium]|nr:PAS domain-containing protein [Deltaproteobacteria bacterium]
MTGQNETTFAPMQEAAELLGQFTKLADDFIFIIDKNLFYRYVNPSLATLFGCSPQEMTGRHLTELFPPDSLGVVQEHLRIVFKSLKTCHFRDRLFFPNHGGELWFDARLTPILDRNGSSIGVLGIARDVTEDRKTEERIAQGKREWEQAIDSLPLLLAVINNEHRITRVNVPLARKMGISVEEAVGLFCYEALHGLHEPLALCPLLRAETAAENDECAMEFYEGHLGTGYLANVSSLRNRIGSIIGCVYVGRPMSGGERAIKPQRRGEERMKLLMRSTDHMVSVHDLQGKYLFFSASPEVGTLTKEVLGKTLLDFFEPSQASRMLERLLRAAATGETLTRLAEVCCYGETFRFFEQISPIKDAAGNAQSVVTISRKLGAKDQPREQSPLVPQNMQGLTLREMEVLRMIASGLTNKEIAEKLFISGKTVATHRARMMRKLDVHRTSALVKIAIKLGLF